MSQTSPVTLCMQNIVISTRIASLCGSQTSPVILRMQNSVISTRVTSLYGSQPSSVVLACKTAWFPPEWQVYMGSALMCGFWMQNSDFRTRITSLCRWIDPTCGFCMQNSDFWTIITSLCGSHTSPVIFCMQNSMPSIRNNSLLGSQPSRVVLGFKTATYGPEKQVSMCPNPHLCFF